MPLKKVNDHMRSNLKREIILIQNKKSNHSLTIPLFKTTKKTDFKTLVQP